MQGCKREFLTVFLLILIAKNGVQMSFNHKKIEKKWQDRWEKEKVFEANPDKRKKFFLTFPYPYVNAHGHIGHFYTLMKVEALARYKRLQSYNVLFPQGWHATGSPIISSAKRVREREPKQMKIMKDMNIPDSEIPKFEDAKYWISFFAPKWKKAYQSMGISVDWRREFHTTSLNPHYDKFVRWQFRKLKEKDYCIRGKFPVVWDPKENVPVGDHDRIEGEGVTTQDFIWAKFKMKNSDLVLMAGTTRPDALYGQTNLWIDPDGKYIIARVRGEKWVVGKEAVEKIKKQFEEKIEVIGAISPEELIGKWVKGPIVKWELHVLPAHFIKSSVGSGIVYSALEDPVDLFELKKIQSTPSIIKRFGLDEKEVKRLKPIDIIRVPGLGDNLGESIGKEFGVKSSKDVKLLELAKGELNRRVFRKGVMRENCGECAGMTVPEAQALLKKKLIKENDAVMFYELTGRVVARSLSECVVKIVEDQWFLDYGNEEWKQKTRECLKQVKLYPEKARPQFEYVVDWLHEWACTREEGLGTRLPWDEKWLIESLSDSTIYMAYYTISHMIKDAPAEKIDDAFFDYVLLGKGKKPELKNAEKMRAEFDYWYPLDFRNSGKDLIQNHLTFFLFNHVAVFPEKKWPKGIGVNGWVTVDGKKMSKSLGNVIPIAELAEKYGADASRVTMLAGGEGIDDPNWDSTMAENMWQKLAQFSELISEFYGIGRSNSNEFDAFFESKHNSLIKEITPFMEDVMFRSAVQKIFFDYWKIFKEYLNFTENNPNKRLFAEIVENFLAMASPFAPHIAEELWHAIGKNGFVSVAKWPVADEKKINKELEKQFEGMEQVVSDVFNILKIVAKKNQKAERVFLYAIPKEVSYYNEQYLSKRIGRQVMVFAANDSKKHDPENKASKTRPGKPAIFVE